MVDFHTHILPRIDDGSGSTEESIAMLKELQKQGVTDIALTPHFYADRSSPDDFFRRRQSSWERIIPHLPSDFPKLRLGAEIRYFDGINRYEKLDRFCLEGTSLLLLEMPCGTWTGRMIATLAELNESKGVSVLLAHIERYWKYQPKDVRRYLMESGIKMQMSAEYVIDRRTRRSALKMLCSGAAHVLGSDCHDIRSRRPNMDAAVDIIGRKLGNDFLHKLTDMELMLLSNSGTAISSSVLATQTGGGQL